MNKNYFNMYARRSITRLLNLRSCFLSSTNPHLNIERFGNVVSLKLNKPKALNALDQDMVLAIEQQVKQWEKENVAVVLLSGEGKGFCAGGDIKTLYNAKINPDPNSKGILTKFFYDEFRTDFAMAQMKPILVALLDGIVMGGGVGLSVMANYRISTKNTLWAMPEAQIGLITDVGAGYFLSRMRNRALGLYLALTGHRLKGADVVYAALADYYFESEKIAELVEDIKASPHIGQESEYILKGLITQHSVKQLPPFSINDKDLQSINEAFIPQGSYRDFHERLEKQKDLNPEFYQQTKESLSRQCPMSLRVIYDRIKYGFELNYKQNLEMDYRVVSKIVMREDFTQGVKSVLIDKQQKPKWQHQDPLDIKDEEVLDCFQNKDLELFPKKA